MDISGWKQTPKLEINIWRKTQKSVRFFHNHLLILFNPWEAWKGKRGKQWRSYFDD